MNTIALSNSQIESKQSFVTATYKLLTGSLIAGAAGAYLGVQYNHILQPYYIGLFILSIALVFATSFARHKEGWNVTLLFSATTIVGLSLGPVLTYTLGYSNGASIVSNAFILTASAFFGLTLYALTTKRNFLGLGKYLFIALIILVVASIINLFVGSSLLMIGLSAIAAILFSFMIVYDTQAIYAGEYDSPISAALGMYLNIINLFVALINLLREFTGEK